jgi:hypothetical protein
MIQDIKVLNTNHGKVLKYSYLVTFLFLTLTGFGQMPIFKRYYIADIPGLGWLAKFYITHFIHYVGAILLLALLAYILLRYFLMDKNKQQITVTGYIRGGLLGGILITGIFLVLRNLKNIWLPPGFIIFLDVTHLGLVMSFLMVALYCHIFRKQWTKTH